MRTQHKVVGAVVFASVLGTSWLASAALGGATGVRIPYNGLLERDGVVLTGDVDLVFAVYDVESGGSACWTSPGMTTTVTSGKFAVVIGPVSESCVKNANVWLEVGVDDGDGLETLPVRQRIYPAVSAMTSANGDFHVGGALTVTGAVSAASMTATSVTTTGAVSGDSVKWKYGEGSNNGNGAIELGRTDGASTTPFIDFHAGANVDYDARLILTGADTLTVTGAVLSAESGVRYGDGTVQTTRLPTLSCTYVESDFVNGTGKLEAYQTMTAGYTLTGGGCRENADGDRQLIRSQPDGANGWYCMSRDEDNSISGGLKAYAFGCKLL